MMKASGRLDMSFLPAGIHTPAKSDLKNSCVDLTSSSALFVTHKKHACSHMHRCTCTYACMPSEPHKNLIFSGRPKSPGAVYCCATGKHTNLSIPDLHQQSRQTMCVHASDLCPPPEKNELQKQWSHSPIKASAYFITSFSIFKFQTQHVLISSCNFSVKSCGRIVQIGTEEVCTHGLLWFTEHACLIQPWGASARDLQKVNLEAQNETDVYNFFKHEIK